MSEELLRDLCRAMVDQNASLKRIEGILAIVAKCQTTLLGMAEARAARSPAAAPSDGGNGSTRKPKGEVLTTTGLGRATLKMKDGQPALTKSKGRMWAFEMDNGFKATLFSESQVKTVNMAAEAKRVLIVDYTDDGQYKNVESIKIGHAKVPDVTKPKAENPLGDDEDSSTDW